MNLPNGYVIEIAGHAACGKSFLVAKLIETLEERGVRCESGSLADFSKRSGAGETARTALLAARWAMRFASSAEGSRFRAFRQAFGRTRIALSACIAPQPNTVYVIDQGLMHYVFFVIAGLFWRQSELLEPLARETFLVANLTPDLMVEVRDRPEVVFARRQERLAHASTQSSTTLDDIEAMFAFTERLRPEIERVAQNNDIECTHVDNREDVTPVIESILCRIDAASTTNSPPSGATA